MDKLIRTTIFLHPDNLESMKELRSDLRKMKDRRGSISQAEFWREVIYEGLTMIALDIEEKELST